MTPDSQRLPRRTIAVTLAALVALAVGVPLLTQSSTPSITVQGDSLSVGMKPYFGPTLSYSAEVGRHVSTGLQILPTQRPFGHFVVFALGTNDYTEPAWVYRGQLRQAHEIVGSGHCMVVPTIWAYHGVPALNRVVRQFAERKDVVYVPWALAVANRDVTLADGLHPAYASGYQIRASLVKKAMESCP